MLEEEMELVRRAADFAMLGKVRERDPGPLRRVMESDIFGVEVIRATADDGRDCN
jgi:hypothetical protein